MKKTTQITPPKLSEGGLPRRSFLSLSAMLGAGLAAAPFGQTKADAHDKVRPAAGKRMLGSLEVSAVGLGCMSMTSGSYNPPRSKADMIPVIRKSFEMGVTFFDTAEVYGPFTDEEIVGEALEPVRDEVVIASKFGFSFDDGQRAGRDARPASIRKAVEGMLKRLRTDRIDLLYLHRMDPNVPVEDIAGTVGELIREGKARHFGMSEVSPETLRKAHAVQPVAALQSEYSVIQRAIENQILDTCEELNIGFVPWGPVCRGFLTDRYNEYTRFSDDSRFSSVPYFTPEAIDAHMKVLDLVREWGVRKDATPAQVSIAWLLAQKPFIVPIPGTTRLHHMKENFGAADISFSEQELGEFREALTSIPLIGVREPQSALVDA